MRPALMCGGVLDMPANMTGIWPGDDVVERGPEPLVRHVHESMPAVCLNISIGTCCALPLPPEA